MKTLRLLGLILTLGGGAAFGSSNVPFFYNDGLSPRDEWGLLHQNKEILPTDLEPRDSVRFHYYFKGSRTLQNDPAYVGAVQTALTRLGYCCGEVDGVYSQDTAGAVMRLQKNYGFRVTGNLNYAVRRALFLP